MPRKIKALGWARSNEGLLNAGHWALARDRRALAAEAPAIFRTAENGPVRAAKLWSIAKARPSRGSGRPDEELKLDPLSARRR
jgi:hypothetical protein